MKKLLKRIAIVLMSFLGIAFLTVGILNWRAARRLETRLAALRDAGKPIQLSDLHSDAVADDQNAWVALQSLQQPLDEYGKLWAETLERTRDLPPEQINDRADRQRIISTLMQKYPNLPAQLRRVCAMAHYQASRNETLIFGEVEATVIEGAGSIRQVARILADHGSKSLNEGDREAAINDAQSILQWSKLAAQRPTLINLLVGFAVRSQGLQLARDILRSDQLSDQQREMLLNAVDDGNLQANQLADSLDTERAFGLSRIYEMGSVIRATAYLGHQEGYLNVIDAAQSAADKTYGTKFDPPDHAGILGQLLMPAVEASLSALRRSQTESRLVHVLNAWIEGESTIDTTIDQLDLPESYKIDPFDGTKLKWKVDEGSIVVYAVGDNLIDDQGRIDDDVDVGIRLPVAN